jgi:hypothetical protein
VTLQADLRLADLRARRRAMEDAYVSVQVVKNIQNSLVNILKLRESKLRPDHKSGSIITKDVLKRDSDDSTGSVALDRLLELEVVIWFSIVAKTSRPNLFSVNLFQGIQAFFSVWVAVAWLFGLSKVITFM